MLSKSTRILSWNINSLLMRRILLKNIISETKPNIILLQEVKISDINAFKIDKFDEYKYSYFSLHETKGYAGVGILSKYAFEIVFEYKSRVIIAYIPQLNTYISTMYMYNGFSATAPLIKKIELFKILINEYSKYENVIIGGDLNICHDIEAFNMINPYTNDEKDLLTQFESIYLPIKCEAKYITWWDYRANSFNQNIGLGLDKFLLKLSFTYNANMNILTKYRGYIYTGITPSDHAPILLYLNY